MLNCALSFGLKAKLCLIKEKESYRSEIAKNRKMVEQVVFYNWKISLMNTDIPELLMPNTEVVLLKYCVVHKTFPEDRKVT